MIEAERPRLQGGVRVTTTDSFAQVLVPEAIAQVSQELGLEIDLIAGNTHLDLGRVQAHVTVRPALVLPSDLEGEAVGAFRFAVYGAPGGRDVWLGLSGPPARSVAGEWLLQKKPQFSMRADSFRHPCRARRHGGGPAQFCP